MRACRCPEKRKRVWERNWVLLEPLRDGMLHRVYTALVRCDECGARWRTVAEYIEHLKQAPK